MIRWASAVFSLVFVSLASADIQWDQPKMETAGDPEKPTTEFKFTNTGDQPIQIISAIPNCECAAVKFSPEPVAPGAKGTVAATFTPGQRSGKQAIEIAVWTDLPDDHPRLLEWTIHLPHVLELAPEVLVWKKDAAKEPRTVQVRFPTTSDTRLLKAECNDPAFKFEINGNQIEVHLVGTPEAAVSVLRVTTDCKLERLREIQIPLAVELTGEE